MWKGYIFKRIKRAYVDRMIVSLIREIEAIQTQGDKLSSLDQGSAHFMEEEALRYQHNKLIDATSALQAFQESRID